MIITKSKKIEDILEFVKEKTNIFIVGCGSCAAACKTGGEDEVIAMKSELESRGKKVLGWIVPDETCHIPLTKKLIMENKDAFNQSEAIIVMACGAGVQTVSVIKDDKEIYPALDTLFLGNTKRIGDFSEHCSLCGECVLGDTAAICPVTRCPKGLLHGPCGGMDEGKCEFDREKDCAWVQIYDRLKALGQLDKLKKIKPAKDYSKHIKPGDLNIGSKARKKIS